MNSGGNCGNSSELIINITTTILPITYTGFSVTYNLRNCMHVAKYHSHSGGAMIYYIKQGITNVINFPNPELFKELIAIGSIDEDSDPEYMADYSLSQWDALNIAIRYELAREQERELENSDIGKAINSLKPPYKF